MVQVGRGEDLDRVDPGVGQQIIELGVGGPATPQIGGRLRPTVNRVAHRHDLAVRMFDVAGHVQRRDVARAHNAQPDDFPQT